jgi:hypothetical protein
MQLNAWTSRKTTNQMACDDVLRASSIVIDNLEKVAVAELLNE